MLVVIARRTLAHPAAGLARLFVGPRENLVILTESRLASEAKVLPAPLPSRSLLYSSPSGDF